MTNQKPKIVVIVGPTASGKTPLAIELAKKFNGEVVSADSRQVYRGLDVGTEKISPKETQGIPHHLIDIVDVGAIYTSVDFRRDADTAIRDISGRGKLPIIAGGTFFYVDTLLGKVSPAEVEPDREFRAGLELKDTDVLFRMLENQDPRRALDIDSENRRRLIRALEIVNVLGNVPASKLEVCPYDVLMIGILTDPVELRARIRARAESAITRGLVEETKILIENGVSKERLKEIGLEYRLVLEFLDGMYDEATLIQKLEEKVWQYAKRQRTWLKRDQSIHWFSLSDTKKIFSTVTTFLQTTD